MYLGRGIASDEQIDRAISTLQRTLNLTSSQSTEIRQLAQSRREDRRAVREQTRAKFEQLMTLMNQPNPDPAAVGRAALDLKSAHDQARTKQTELESQFMKVLNPSQQRVVNNLRSQADTFFALSRLGVLRPSEGGPRTSMNQNRETSGSGEN
jgi:Spy/CpxP family protein refolding chaperone